MEQLKKYKHASKNWKLTTRLTKPLPAQRGKIGENDAVDHQKDQTSHTRGVIRRIIARMIVQLTSTSKSHDAAVQWRVFKMGPIS